MEIRTAEMIQLAFSSPPTTLAMVAANYFRRKSEMCLVKGGMPKAWTYRASSGQLDDLGNVDHEQCLYT